MNSPQTFGNIMPAKMTHIPGYIDVQDLIPNGSFINCTDIWRLCLEHYRDEADFLKFRFVLEMTQDRQKDSPERVAVIMEQPAQISYPDSSQILGLDFEDVTANGLEDISWRVYDYESSNLHLYCKSIRFEKRKTEQGS